MGFGAMVAVFIAGVAVLVYQASVFPVCDDERGAQIVMLDELSQRIETARAKTGRHPTTAEVDLLMREPIPYLPYFDRPKRDVWGGQHRYVYPAEHSEHGFDLSSAGPDGRFGTEDDVRNW